MKILENIGQLAFAVVFVGTTFMTIFGAGKLIDTTLSTYVLKYETCDYKPAVRIEPEQPQELNKEECSVDYNRAKNDLASGISMFVVGLPVAWFVLRKLRN